MDDRLRLRAITRAFPSARPESRAAILGSARVVRREAGSRLFGQGDPPRITIIHRGVVVLQRVMPDGREIVARVLKPGAVVGLLPLIHRRAVVEAVTLTDAVVVECRATAFREGVEDDAGLAGDALRHSLAAVAELAERIDTLVYQNAEVRMARTLERYRDLWFSHPPTLHLRDAPRMSGTSREMAGRALRRLESRGIVQRSGTAIRLTDAHGLRNIAYEDHGS